MPQFDKLIFVNEFCVFIVVFFVFQFFIFVMVEELLSGSFLRVVVHLCVLRLGLVGVLRGELFARRLCFARAWFVSWIFFLGGLGWSIMDCVGFSSNSRVVVPWTVLCVVV